MNSLPFDFMTYGNGLVEFGAYNNRLQPSQFLTYNPNNNAAVLNLSYGFTASDGSTTATCVAGLQRDAGLHAQLYLRRTKSPVHHVLPADATGCTGLSWTYDAWANRTNQTTTSGACTESHPVSRYRGK